MTNKNVALRHVVLRLAIAPLLGMSAFLAKAAEPLDYGEAALGPKEKDAVLQALGPDAFGETINTFTGGISFSHVDLSIPGNNGLPVEIRRSLTVDGNKSPTQPNDAELWRGRAFGEWELDLPYLSGIYPESVGWHVNTASPNARCSSPTTLDQYRPKHQSVGEVFFLNFSFWNGVSLNLPGGEQQKLVFRPSNSTLPTPSSGSWTPLTTAQHWRFSCTPTLASGQAGEGFVALAPDGTKYTFNWMTSLPERPLRGRAQIILANGPTLWVNEQMPRREYRLYPTRVEDVHGNWVNYTWSGSNLSSITSSDGRSITLSYSLGRISSISDGMRQVNYTYTNGLLTGVTLPDASTWAFSTAPVIGLKRFVAMTDPNPWDFPMDCQRMRRLSGEEVALTIKHPSGATASYALGYKRHYRTGLVGSTGDCAKFTKEDGPSSPQDDKPLNNTRFDVLAVKRKDVTGPGLSGLQWVFAHSDAYSMAPFYPADGTRTVTETRPDGSSQVSVFGTDARTNEGQLLSTEIRENGVVLRRTENVYVQNGDIAALPFPTWVGEPLFYEFHRGRGDYTRPLRATTIYQQGESFSSLVEQFDALARPVQVQKFSSLGYSRRDVTTYFDHLGKWRLGQVAQTWNDEEDQILSRAEFDAITGSPVRFYGPGKASSPSATPTVAPQLIQTVTYRLDGTVAILKDGRDLVTQFNDWYRGVPRQIVFADGSSRSASVDGAGRVTSATNELSHTTSYAYDAGGRLAQLTWPTGDSVAWTPTQIAYAQVGTTEHGLGPGHWRRTETRGDYRKFTYYDALWRPVIEHEYDAANQAATQRFYRKAYDVGGQLSFEAYPGTTASLTTGVRHFFDGLGRPTRSEQDSELAQGALVTQHTYLAGFRTRLTNPRLYVTETHFQAFDQPSTEVPIKIIAALGEPEQQTTDIARNVLGQPLSVTRSGQYGGSPVTLIRNYVYDPRMRLCKRIEPETGALVVEYDGAGNVIWAAEGQLLAGLACDRSSVAASERTVRTYDSRNRLTLVDYPDSTPDVSTTYTANGLVESVSRAPTLLTYGYNKRGLLESERLQFGSIDWLAGHAYTTLGHLGADIYPSGHEVAYAPNALGQATQAGTYATGAKYHPNGALAEFTYGNGIVHTMTYNARQLPERSLDALGTNVILDDSYDYDANGNVAAISDGLPDGPGNRDMSYDALDRLIGLVAGPAQGGNGTFAYDPLDNLRALDQGGRQFRYHYGVDNRLAEIRSPASLLLHSFGYDSRGNAIAKGGGTLSFDRENRLIASAIPEPTSYFYDGLGRRVEESSSVPTRFYYSYEGKLLHTNDHKSQSSTDHIYLAGSLVAARTVPFGSGSSKVTYQHTDALGSPVAFTDAAGDVSDREPLTAWGEPADGTWTSSPGYTGHQMDSGAKLIYMQQRYYDPALGRFLSTDPVAIEDNWDIRHFNRFAYAYNNPYRFSDPDGRCPLCLVPFVIGLLTHSDPANAPAPGEVPESTPASESLAAALPPAKLFTPVKMMAGAGDRLSQRAATREAKRQAGIPTSQQASAQTNGRASDGTPVGRQQTFEVPAPGGGVEKKSVQVSRDQRGAHAGMTQIEAGKVKSGGQTDEAGRPRLQNEGKVRVDFEKRR